MYTNVSLCIYKPVCSESKCVLMCVYVCTYVCVFMCMHARKLVLCSLPATEKRCSPGTTCRAVTIPASGSKWANCSTAWHGSIW